MKATETAGYKYTSTTLYRVPTVEPYSGEESFAFVNPRLVSALQPDQIDIGEEFPGNKTINGTRVVTAEEVYFVPLSVTDTADKLDMDLVGLEQEATA
jgi:hypothetical protein